MNKAAVVVFGANGFLGSYVSRYYIAQGKRVVGVVREGKKAPEGCETREWDGKTIGSWAEALEGAEAVIQLCGRSVNGRDSEIEQKAIISSRVDSARVIGAGIAQCNQAPRVWLCASSAGWYQETQEQSQDEWQGELGNDFLSEVARKAEEAFYGVCVPGVTRKVALRIGYVLAAEQGTVWGMLMKWIRWGLGGDMGGGKQRVSWMHVEDFTRAVDFLVKDAFQSGVFNVCAPTHPTNREWMAAMRNAAGVNVGIALPAWAVTRLACWQGRRAGLVLKSRVVAPLRLRDAGFQWDWPKIESAMMDLSHRKECE